jgi:precorrin-2 dehydrogenase / sirohydrochlorin ferrochelatase
MPHLPLNIDMNNRTSLVVGGGAVASRKVKVLLDAGAGVHVVALSLGRDLADLWSEGSITARIASYDPADLEGVFLVIAATDSAEANRTIARDARKRGVLIAVADAPESGNCTFPALLRRGGLEIAVSTGGRCPAFASLVRDHIAGVIGDDYGAVLEQLAEEREKLLTEGNSSPYNAVIMRSLAQRLMSQMPTHKEAP